jgi:hypothetical protein
MQIRLHDHREQRLIHPPAPLQQAREERAGPQLRDPQLQVTGRRGDRLGPVAIALRRPGVAAFVRAGADHRRQFGLDQSLVDRRCRLLDPVFDIGALECLEHIDQGRLVQSHRVTCPSARTIGVVSLTITRWPSHTWSPTPSGPTSYTTSWDVTTVGHHPETNTPRPAAHSEDQLTLLLTVRGGSELSCVRQTSVPIDVSGSWTTRVDTAFLSVSSRSCG